MTLADARLDLLRDMAVMLFPDRKCPTPDEYQRDCGQPSCVWCSAVYADGALRYDGPHLYPDKLTADALRAAKERRTS